MKQVILISGATRGMGFVTANRLHRAGCHVFGTGRNPTPAGAPFRLLPLDVGDEASVQACVAQVIDEAGQIDVLVNNAGYDLYGAAEETPWTEFLAQVATNLFVSLVEPGQVRTNTLDVSMRSGQSPPSGRIAERARAQGRVASLTSEQVADAIVRVVETPRPRLRYRVGRQVQAVVLLKQLLPQALFERFIMRQFVQPVTSELLSRTLLLMNLAKPV